MKHRKRFFLLKQRENTIYMQRETEDPCLPLLQESADISQYLPYINDNGTGLLDINSEIVSNLFPTRVYDMAFDKSRSNRISLHTHHGIPPLAASSNLSGFTALKLSLLCGSKTYPQRRRS